MEVETLRKKLAESGKCGDIPLGDLSEAALKSLARSLDIKTPRKPVSLENKFGGTYAQIPPINYVDAEGNDRRTRHFSVRVEAIDQLIKDLEKARVLLASRD